VSPSDPGERKFLLLSARTPAVAEFTGRTLDTRRGSAASLRLKHGVFPRESRADAGQTAHYMLRWLSTRGEAGPWSETASATVGA